MSKLKLKKTSALLLATIILCSAILCSLTSCVTPSVGATYLDLDKTEATMYVGETLTLTVETDGEVRDVIWSSDATHIAKVDGGVVTAVAEGEVTIKARIGEARAFCDISIVRKPDSEPDPDTKPDPKPEPQPTLREGYLCDIYSDFFMIGAAVQTNKLVYNGYGELMPHFNSITAENNMKWKNLVKTKGVYDFNQSNDSADRLINWAKSNGVAVRGHTLLWYKSVPTWLHEELGGKGYTPALREKAMSYINEHIETVMEHFGDDVYVWDVVNEALYNSVDASKLATTGQNPYGNIWRTNDGMKEEDSDWVDWYKVTGSYYYIAEAFIKAGEVREKNNLKVELFYNDYGLHDPYKRQAALNLVQMLRDNNAPIDGIGMQAHYKLWEYLEDKDRFLKNLEDSIKAFLDAGLDIHITELDIRYDGEYNQSVEELQGEMYGEIFKILRKYAKTDDMAHGITSVTTWGVYDGCNGAWGANNNILIFGKDKTPKKAYYEISTY